MAAESSMVSCLATEDLVQRQRGRNRVGRENISLLVRSAGDVVGARAPFDPAHGIRTSHHSYCLGRTMGLSRDELQQLGWSAFYHDIGKQELPETVLCTPGKLSRQERLLINRHAQMGYELLSGWHSELREVARTVALTHHEHWDGSGYPFGLKGKDIPLYTRIVSIADVFDALISERCYKPAWPISSAVTFIQNGREAQFDPWLVDKFEKILPDILAIV
jgi:HD-GYP domain-containing protein (c-di-GMP phosphodiesterase class II)